MAKKAFIFLNCDEEKSPESFIDVLPTAKAGGFLNTQV